MFRVFFDMDGTLAEWKAAKEPEDLYEKDYFLSLKPYQSVVEAAWKLYESGEAEVFILSAVLADSPLCHFGEECVARRVSEFCGCGPPAICRKLRPQASACSGRRQNDRCARR